MDLKIRCERCNEVLNPKTVVWRDLSNTDGKFYIDCPEGHISQGGFPFGSACAKTQWKEDHNERIDELKMLIPLEMDPFAQLSLQKELDILIKKKWNHENKYH